MAGGTKMLLAGKGVDTMDESDWEQELGDEVSEEHVEEEEESDEIEEEEERDEEIDFSDYNG